MCCSCNGRLVRIPRPPPSLIWISCLPMSKCVNIPLTPSIDEEVKAIMLKVAKVLPTNELDDVLDFCSEDTIIFGLDKRSGKGKAGELTYHPATFDREELRPSTANVYN